MREEEKIKIAMMKKFFASLIISLNEESQKSLLITTPVFSV